VRGQEYEVSRPSCQTPVIDGRIQSFVRDCEPIWRTRLVHDKALYAFYRDLANREQRVTIYDLDMRVRRIAKRAYSSSWTTYWEWREVVRAMPRAKRCPPCGRRYRWPDRQFCSPACERGDLGAIRRSRVLLKSIRQLLKGGDWDSAERKRGWTPTVRP